MQLRHLIAPLLAAGLAACGGGADDSSNVPAEASGVLAAGGAQGVHYSTATRSGTTDAAGTFKYLPGETVSFSIGTIQLGSAPGASTITAFTLAGATPPTTELALRGELDHARRNVTPFARAVNIQWLLLALDADHDPANGLDLRNAETVLAGASIDPGKKLRTFGSALMKLAPGLTIQVQPWKAVAEAYRAINVTVPVHARTANRQTPDGSLMVTNTFTTYGAGGVRATYGTDLGDDGAAEILQAWTYDSLGRVKTQSTHMDPSVTPSPTNRDTTFQYDAKGAITAIEDAVDDLSDGSVNFVIRQGFQNDTYGFPLVVSEQDLSGDGVTLIARSEQRAVYDARHNQTSSARDSDDNADGVLDTRWTQTGTFDSSDRYTGSVSENDLDGDGTIDDRSVSTIDYSGAPGTIVSTSDIDSNADGVIDARYRRTSRFDSQGFLLSEDYDDDYDADGTPDSHSHADYRYDADHRILEIETISDFDADGVIEARTRRTTTYDSIGNPLTIRTYFERVDIGPIEYEYLEDRQYGASGEFLGSQTDAPPGSAIPAPYVGTTVATEVQVADGVLLLAQDYFEPLFEVGYASTTPYSAMPTASRTTVCSSPSPSMRKATWCP